MKYHDFSEAFMRFLTVLAWSVSETCFPHQHNVNKFQIPLNNSLSPKSCFETYETSHNSNLYFDLLMGLFDELKSVAGFMIY